MDFLSHLAPGDLQSACKYKDKKGKEHKPDWRDATNGKSYFPSYNIAPGSHTPVLLSANHFSDEHTSERVIQPMLWGLIPSWHKGTPSEKTYETNNCRSESMLEKMTYKVPLQKGRRCVILAEGFFEWKRANGVKQPYYIYFPQSHTCHTTQQDGAELKVKEELKTEVKSEPCEIKQEAEDNKQEIKIKEEFELEGKNGKDCSEDDDCDVKAVPRLLTMAGVFDVWTPPTGGEPVYSYSVITVESSSAMSWIHHRMPAMLTSDEEIDQWLNFGEVPLSKASKLIRAVTCLDSHPVSSVVNNSRNKTPDCVKKIDLNKPKKSAGSLFMSAWLSKGQKVKSEEPPDKKMRVS